MRHPQATALLKNNIDAMLSARHQKRKDLALWCRRTEAWLSQIFTDDERNVPLKYLDRIADFFGIATYQLFQPGISSLTERRKGQRRSGRDRRISAAVPLSQRPGDVDLMDIIRALSREGREQAIEEASKILGKELQRLRIGQSGAAAAGRTVENAEATRVQGRAPKSRPPKTG